MKFENLFVSDLPGDRSWDASRRQVLEACYSLVKPTPILAPCFIALSEDAAQLVDL